MNQDAWIYEDSIEKLMEVYNTHPNKDEIGILSPMHIDGSEKNWISFWINTYHITVTRQD
ncbi:hypothetical protein [Chryseobacterium wanjuense]